MTFDLDARRFTLTYIGQARRLRSSSQWLVRKEFTGGKHRRCCDGRPCRGCAINSR